MFRGLTEMCKMIILYAHTKYILLDYHIQVLKYLTETEYITSIETIVKIYYILD